MIVTFQSKASGDVIMFGDVAHHMMQLMHKDITPQGIITVEQLPDALACLRAAVTRDKDEHARQVAEALDTQKDAIHDDDAHQATPPVSLTQRALPLIELLERSLKKRVPVLWGI
jgi:precorrin-4 methylase